MEGLLNCIPWVHVAACIMLTWIRLLRLAKDSLWCVLILTQISGTFEIRAAQPENLTFDSSQEVTGKINGYRGIWFDLGQRSDYGSKYSGGLGTYTAKHCPTAIYSKQTHKTFFVYGGTTQQEERRLLAMVGFFDHSTGMVCQPSVVHDKQKVNDPHDNPSLSIDSEGYLWVFISGRARHRPGFKYRSTEPYKIDAFEQISEEEFTYPQPWWIPGQGVLHLFTKYTQGRELYWNRSQYGLGWTREQKLAGMGGHYQISRCIGSGVITAFNYHPKGNVDKRTNLYFLETSNQGESWQTVDQRKVTPPLTQTDHMALVKDYEADSRLVYLKDITVDGKGNPVILYITSDHHEPGPHLRNREWTFAQWDGHEWNLSNITQAWHNYDMGSLYIEPDQTWRLIAPIGPGPQRYGTGGEMAIWIRSPEKRQWSHFRNLTEESPRNHGYARRPVNAHHDFYAFWADGNPDRLTPSFLYFTNKNGTRLWKLPYTMSHELEKPIRQY